MTENMIPPAEPLGADAGVPVGAIVTPGEPLQNGTLRPLPEDALIILPVREVVLFPGAVMPLRIGRERSRTAAMEAARLQRPLGVERMHRVLKHMHAFARHNTHTHTHTHARTHTRTHTNTHQCLRIPSAAQMQRRSWIR